MKATRKTNETHPTRKEKKDAYVPVKADPPEVRGEIGLSSPDGAPAKKRDRFTNLLDRLGPNAVEFSGKAPDELVAARLRLTDMINNCNPDMPFAHNIVVDRWFNQAMAERIRGQDLINRKLTEAQVEPLMRDMLRPGAWKPNGEPIRFTYNGQVIDGQGRIIAFELACRKNPALTFVTDLRFNVPKEAFSTIGTGKRRSAKDVLDSMHIGNGFLKSAMARLWHGYHSGRIRGQKKITNDEVREVVVANLELFDEASRMVSHAIKESKIPGSVLGFCCALGLRTDRQNRTDRQKTALFFSQITTGLNLKEDDPAYALIRATKNKARSNRKGVDQIELAALTIKAMNAHFRGEPMEVVSWRRNEPFPRFIGDTSRSLKDDTPYADDDTEGVSVESGAEMDMAEAV